jgi:hypothetical protein
MNLSWYQAFLIGHIAVFGIWFGTDIATFILSRKVLDPGIEVVARRGLAGAMTAIEVIARICLPAMLALGLSLSINTGLLDVSTGWIPVVWIVVAGWLALIWRVHTSSGEKELDNLLSVFDLIIRTIICLGLWVAGLVTLVGGDGPFLGDWLGVKVLLFALIMTCGITIRFLLKPFAAAFGDLVVNGSTPERESRLKESLRRAQPLVGVIWFSLLSATILGVTRTLPWQ